MTQLPAVASPEAWLTARRRLLDRESELNRHRDEVNTERRRLPMVKMTRTYAFEGPEGSIGLLDLFDGRRQLLVYHFWFQPGEEPCQGCSMWARNLGSLADLYAHDTSLAMVSPATSAEIESVKEHRGWIAPWFSTGSDFNDDVGYSGEAQITVFLRDDNTVFRTYATSGRDLETLSNHWALLDLTPLTDESV